MSVHVKAHTSKQCLRLLGRLPVLVGVLSGATAARAEAGLLNWTDWYPLDRGQALNQRAVNFWTNGTSHFTGQSTMKVAAPATLPASYQGRTIGYFLNWPCNENQQNFPPASADCRVNANDYFEYMSQGTASNDNTYLEHWTRGFSLGTYYEYYFNPGTYPVSTCTLAGLSGQNLASPSLKVPLILGLPATSGEEWVSPPVCTVVFKSTSSVVSPSNVNSLYTGHWIVATKNVSTGTDSSGNQIINAINEYYVANRDWVNVHTPFCNSEPNGSVCSNGVPKTRVINGVIFYIWLAEAYSMRKMRTR